MARTFAVVRKDGTDTPPSGFVQTHDEKSFRWDADATSHEDDAARLEARLDLALAALESVGYAVEFMEEDDETAEPVVDKLKRWESLDRGPNVFPDTKRPDDEAR